MFRTYVVVCISFAAIASSVVSVRGQTPQKDISDGFVIFMNFCITTNGHPYKAEAQIGQGNEIARRLPPEMVSRVQKGTVGGKAWTFKSPTADLFLLEYHPNGLCSVRFQEITQEAALRDTDKLISILRPKFGQHFYKKAESGKPEFKKIHHEIQTKTDTYNIVISASKERIAEHKAIISLEYKKSQ